MINTIFKICVGLLSLVNAPHSPVSYLLHVYIGLARGVGLVNINALWPCLEAPPLEKSINFQLTINFHSKKYF